MNYMRGDLPVKPIINMKTTIPLHIELVLCLKCSFVKGDLKIYNVPLRAG